MNIDDWERNLTLLSYFTATGEIWNDKTGPMGKKPNVEKQNCCQHMLEFWGNYKKFWVNIPSRKLYILGISEPSLTWKWSHVKLFSTPFLVKGHSWWKTKENDVHVCLLLKVKWQRRRGIPLQDGFVSWDNALPNSHPVRDILWESNGKTLKYTQHQFNFFMFLCFLVSQS